MKKGKNIEFDELDLKCLNEMPLLIDVLASTGNKVGKLLSNYHNDLKNVLSDTLPKGWSISNSSNSKDSYEILYFPITDEYDMPKIKINTLSSQIRIESCFKIIKEGQKGVFLWLFFGYLCYSYEEEIINTFYFSFSKSEIKEKNGGTLNTLDFYKKIEQKITNYDIEILHPEQNDDTESFEISVKDFNIITINDAYKTYLENVVTPILINLK